MQFTPESRQQALGLLSVNAEKLVGLSEPKIVKTFQDSVYSINRIGEYLLPNGTLIGITPDQPKHLVHIDTGVVRLGNINPDSFNRILHEEDSDAFTRLQLSSSNKMPPTIVVSGAINDPDLVGGDHPLTNLEKHVKRVQAFMPQLEKANQENTFKNLGVTQEIRSINNILDKHTIVIPEQDVVLNISNSVKV
jgi:hypothetical protein